MKKKIKDLTKEEGEKICAEMSKYMFPCINCVLMGLCPATLFIQKEKPLEELMEKEVEI